jgi:hypothetical protein
VPARNIPGIWRFAYECPPGHENGNEACLIRTAVIRQAEGPTISHCGRGWRRSSLLSGF